MYKVYLISTTALQHETTREWCKYSADSDGKDRAHISFMGTAIASVYKIAEHCTRRLNV